MLHDPACQTLYRSRKDLIRKLDETRQRRDDLVSRVRALEEKSAVLNNRLGELLAMAEAKTGEYVGTRVQIERLQLAPSAS